MVMLYSSSMAMVNSKTHMAVGAHLLIMQIIWCGLGLVACVAAASVDYRVLSKLAPAIYVAAIILLALVLEKHFGVIRGGARRWFSFHGINLQPSEFAKL